MAEPGGEGVPRRGFGDLCPSGVPAAGKRGNLSTSREEVDMLIISGITRYSSEASRLGNCRPWNRFLLRKVMVQVLLFFPIMSFESKDFGWNPPAGVS